MQISPLGWCILFLAAAIIGFSKTGFTGVGILAIPLAAMVIPAKASTGLILPMLLVGDIMAVAIYRRHAIWKYLVKLMPCAVAGILIGYALLDMVNDRQLKVIIGAIILTLLTLSWYRNRALAKTGELHIPQNWWFPVVIGVLGGIVTMMANAAGPILIIYLLAMRLPKHAFIGTGAWYFLLLNAFKVPFFWNKGLITPDSLFFNLKLAPIIVAGGFAGFYLVKFVPEKAFTRIAQVLTAIAALQLLLSPVNLKLPLPSLDNSSATHPSPGTLPAK